MAEAAPDALAARLGLRVLVASVRGLGPLRRPCAYMVGLFWYLTQSRDARRRVASNHRRLQPRLDQREAAALARRSFCEYIAMMSDVIWAEPFGADDILRLVRFIALGNLDAGDEGAVMVIAHFGNWDMAASAAMALGRPLTTVMAPIGSPLLTSMVRVSRTRKGLELFSPKQAARGLVRALRRRRLVALMADVPEAGPTVVVTYCGGPVRFSAVPARLAAATNRPIIPVACWREGRRWGLEFYPPVRCDGEDETAVMARVAAAVEPAVRRHPEQWYPFHEVYADSPGSS